MSGYIGEQLGFTSLALLGPNKGGRDPHRPFPAAFCKDPLCEDTFELHKSPEREQTAHGHPGPSLPHSPTRLLGMFLPQELLSGDICCYGNHRRPGTEEG